MNVGWIQKYALNLGWFLLLLGGISLLDRGLWFYAGLILVLCGLLNLINTLRMIYLGKQSWLLSPANIYWANILGLILLAIAHVFTTKKEVSWELIGFLALSLVFFLVAKTGSNGLAQKPAFSKKASVKR